jgi:hypothetical protein
MRKLILLLGLVLLLSTAVVGWAQCIQTYNTHVDDSNFSAGPHCAPDGTACGYCVDSGGGGGSTETCYIDFSTWDEYCIYEADNQTP